MPTLLRRCWAIVSTGNEIADGQDLHQIREHDLVLERLCDPDQVQRVLIDADLLRQQRRIVRAQKRSTVGVDAQSKVSHSYLEHSLANDVGYRRCDPRIHLGRVVRWRISLVVKVDEEDIWYRGRTR